jgi:hypothetical protein
MIEKLKQIEDKLFWLLDPYNPNKIWCSGGGKQNCPFCTIMEQAVTLQKLQEELVQGEGFEPSTAGIKGRCPTS